ncbi:MAG: hypothetical protein H7338_10745 [Candidatus Sericytochromatia bacterium]|nr:hypothetical protein [Candidatus Sericytochromatia bacterium]
MRTGFRLRGPGGGLLSLAIVAGGLAVATPAQAQTRTETERRTVVIVVPIVSTMNYGPTRLIGLEAPQTLRPGVAMASGALWASNLGATGAGIGGANTATGTGISNFFSGMNAGLIVDYGFAEGLQLQLQGGMAGQGQAALSAMGKYTLLNEAYGGAPLSLGLMARVHGMLPAISDIAKLNLGNANVGFTFGVPLSKAVTDRLVVMAVPGLTFIGGTTGLVTAANLGLGADFAITDRFRALVDASIGMPTAGIVAVPSGNAFSAGIRYAISDAFTTDLYLGIGGVRPVTGLSLPLTVPSLGLGASYRF